MDLKAHLDAVATAAVEANTEEAWIAACETISAAASVDIDLAYDTLRTMVRAHEIKNGLLVERHGRWVWADDTKKIEPIWKAPTCVKVFFNYMKAQPNLYWDAANKKFMHVCAPCKEELERPPTIN